MFRRSDPVLTGILGELREEVQVMREEVHVMHEELRLIRESHEREHRLNREESANHRAFLADLSAQVRSSVEENRRHTDAVVGALTDLAAEIRGWGGGAAPA